MKTNTKTTIKTATFVVVCFITMKIITAGLIYYGLS